LIKGDCVLKGGAVFLSLLFYKKASFVMNALPSTETPESRLTLVNRTLGDRPQKTVNARALYAFLNVSKDFSSWIKKRIQDYGFIEEVDFIRVDSKDTSQGGNSRIDYFLSLDMAKEVSMVERTPQGQRARRYFIACEAALSARLPRALRSDTPLWDKTKAALCLIEQSHHFLRYSPATLLGRLQKVETLIGIPGLLPSYAIDSPDGGGFLDSSELTQSATVLLAQYGKPLSILAFNQKAEHLGFIQTLERPTPKGPKRFRSITDRGLAYGKNVTAPENPRETQPHWYTSRFAALLEVMGVPIKKRQDIPKEGEKALGDPPNTVTPLRAKPKKAPSKQEAGPGPSMPTQQQSLLF
jgi:phage anti-repressor protein